jgi:uncharacterized repeat protein (TIGR01451 family)
MAVACGLGNLAVGGSAQIQIVVHVPAGLQGQTLINRATVAADQPDPDGGNDAAQATTTVGDPEAGNFDLSLTKAVATTGPAKAGAPLRYTLTAANAGPATARGVTVTDTLSANVRFVSANIPGGACTRKGAVVTCAMGDLPAGASRTATLTVMPLLAGPLRNDASLRSEVADRDAANDVAGVHVAVTAPKARLTIKKSVVTRGPFKPGRRAWLRIVVRNPSRNAATRVRVCDVPARGASYVRMPGAKLRRGTACWDVGLMRAGQRKSFRVKVRIGNVDRRRLRSSAVVTSANAPTRRDSVALRLIGGWTRPGGVTG